MRRQLISLIVAILLLCSLGMPVFAHDVPDLTRPGTIKVSMCCGETSVPGGSLSVYQVGYIHEENGNYSYQLTEDFAESQLTLENVQSAELAAGLAEYTVAHGLEGVTKDIDDEGRVTFDVEPGLYLLVQQDPARGYSAAKPFLVGVPNMEDGTYIYEVNASPKINLTPAPTEESTEPHNPTKPDEKLPQTGQLNWPVPLLAVAGLGLFLLGCVLRRKENDEA